MPSIRRATAGDIPSIVDLRVAFLRDVREVGDEASLRKVVTEYLSRALPSEQCVVWVAEAESKIVATGAMTVYERMMWDGVGREGYVLSMYTAPEYRKQGVAGEIVEAMLSFAREENLRLCLIATDEGRPIYERAGFEPDARYLRWR